MWISFECKLKVCYVNWLWYWFWLINSCLIVWDGSVCFGDFFDERGRIEFEGGN